MVFVDATLTWSPTVTRHTRPRPNAPTVVHVIAVCGVVTLHDTAEYTTELPGTWYDALMAVSPIAPRFDPLIVTATPPAVGMLSSEYPDAADTDRSVIAGAAYDDVTLGSRIDADSPATVTFQRRFVPTPGTVLH